VIPNHYSSLLLFLVGDFRQSLLINASLATVKLQLNSFQHTSLRPFNMATVLVTGTNQGIGFGLVQELVKRSDVSQIFATVRDPTSSASAELVDLAKTAKNLHVIKMVLKEDAIAVLVI